MQEIAECRTYFRDRVTVEAEELNKAVSEREESIATPNLGSEKMA